MIYRPETAGPLNELTELLLAGDNTLSRGDRELIAAYVSRLNKCDFCGTIHGVMAARQLPDGASQVEQACTNPHAADVTPKMRALLDIAALVQQSGRAVTQEAVDAARTAGATDPEIHDTVETPAVCSSGRVPLSTSIRARCIADIGSAVSASGPL
ncbi:carboxymuconolactone decarboxylase family protein [Microtetraspora malaysiensis]|uniref:carboxymuconolactone decarboxylase family protein n=1 Tax=Microtetraspora malaysiensis TaxID=161358 RepID=UPI003D8DFE8A